MTRATTILDDPPRPGRRRMRRARVRTLRRLRSGLARGVLLELDLERVAPILASGAAELVG